MENKLKFMLKIREFVKNCTKNAKKRIFFHFLTFYSLRTNAQRASKEAFPLFPTFSEKSFTNIFMCDSMTLGSSICANLSINGVTRFSRLRAIFKLSRISFST